MPMRATLDSATITSRASAVKEIFQALEAQGRMKVWLARELGNISLAKLRAYRLGITPMPADHIKIARQALGLKGK